MDYPNDSRSSRFLEFCVRVRNNDPSILPAPGKPFRIRSLSEKLHIELADALLENNNVTYLLLETDNYTKCSAEAMAKYVRTSKRLQRIYWATKNAGDELKQREKIESCFLHAFQESTSLKELDMELPPFGGPSSLALENMLTHTQSLRSLSLFYRSVSLLEDIAMAAVQSGLEKNTTLRELKLSFPRSAATISPILTSLRDHPHLRKLSLSGHVLDVTGLETVLLSDTSNISELKINNFLGKLPIIGLTHVLQALARRPALTKLKLCNCRLGRDETRLVGMVLRNISSLESLVLRESTLGSAEFAELAPALCHNTSLRELDISKNNLNDMESAELLRDILRRNKTIATLDLSWNEFGKTPGAVECIADGLGSNLTLLKIHLARCRLRNDGASALARKLGSRKTTLQKLTLDVNSITGVRALLASMVQTSHHIMDLELDYNPIGNSGANRLARSLGKNALPNLTRLSLSHCGILDDGFIALVSALEQNTSLLRLRLGNNNRVTKRKRRPLSKRAFLALAKSLPDIKVLQQIEFCWWPDLASAMPLLLVGLRKNTSLFRFHVANCAPSLVPPNRRDTAKCGWMQEMERLGYRNRFRTLIRAPKEALPPRAIWPRALARVAMLPDVIFEVLRAKPSLVPSEETRGKEADKDTGVPTKRKRGDK